MEKTQKPASYKPFRSSIMIGVIAVLVLVLGGVLWTLCVVTIDPGYIGIVVHKRGKTPPPGRFIVEEGYKGTQREVLRPGLHFFWTTTAFMEISKVPVTVVPNGKVGVLIAQDGRELREGAVLAEDDQIDEKTGELVQMGEKGIRKNDVETGNLSDQHQIFQHRTV